MREILAALKSLRWLEVLEESPRISGDTRFLKDYFLPGYAWYRQEPFSDILARLNDDFLLKEGGVSWAVRGRLRRMAGDFRAADDFERALKSDPRCAEAFAFRGEMRIVGDPQAALEDLGRAIRLEPGNPFYRLWRGYAFFLLGDGHSAEKTLTLAIAKGRRCAAALVLRGLVREEEGDFSGAQEDYSRAVVINPRCPGLYTLRAGVRFNRGDRKGAVEDAHKAIDLHPENLDAFVRLAHLFQGHDPRSPGKVLDFAEAAEKIIIENPACAWAYALRAEAVGRRRSPADARKSLQDLQRADKLDPKRAWIKAFLGRALSAGDEREGLRRGLKLFDAAARLAPRSGWIFSWRAQIRVKLGENRRALSDLDKGLSLDPDYRLAYAWRAELREKLGDDGGAAMDLTRCLAALPRPTFYHRRALIRWRRKETLGALEDLTRCVGLTPQFDLAYGGFDFLVSLFDKAGREWRLSRPDLLLKARPFLREQPRIPAGDLPFIRGGPLLLPSRLKAATALRCDRGPASLFLRLNPSDLTDAIQANAGSGFAHAWLGRSYLNAGEFSAALVSLERALSLDPRCFAALAWRGEAHCRMGDYAAALTDLDRGAAHEPLFFSTLLWRGAARAGRGEYECAFRDWLSACGKDSGKANLVFWWIRWTLPRVAFYFKESGSAALLAAELALLAGQPGRALGWLRGAVLSESQKARAYALRAKAKRLTGDLEGALRDAACAKLGVGA